MIYDKMEFHIQSTKRLEVIDITDSVNNIVKDSGIKDGICNIFVPHATAAITVNENADPNIGLDFNKSLSDLIPNGKWLHDKIDNNADSHIKASIVGASESIPVRDGQLSLGTWQDVFLCDFDGPRKRRVIVTILKA